MKKKKKNPRCILAPRHVTVPWLSGALFPRANLGNAHREWHASDFGHDSDLKPVIRKTFPKEMIPNVDKSLCAKDAHQGITSKGKNPETPYCPTMGTCPANYDSTPVAGYSHDSGKCPNKGEGGRSREQLLYIL